MSHMNLAEWRPIAGFSGYEVSSGGLVRSLDRIDYGGRRLRGKILRPSRTRTGYLSVFLRRDGLSFRRYVHHLVLSAFLSPMPLDSQACHRDGNPGNNTLPNLRWGTKTSNEADKLRHGTRRRGETCPVSRLKESDIRKAFAMRKAGHTQKQIGEAIGASTGHVCDILNGKDWKHIERI